MANKEKLKKILLGMDRSDPQVRSSLKLAEKGIADVIEKIKGDAEIKTIEFAKKKVNEIKVQMQSILDYLSKLKEDLKKNEDDLTGSLNQKLDVLRSRMAEYRTASLDKLGILSSEMDDLKGDIREISSKKVEIPDFRNQIKDVQDQLKKAMVDLAQENEEKMQEFLTNAQKTITDLDGEIRKLRRDTMSAMAGRGGGNMNRNILISGNPSTLGRYTDVNLKPGSNITISYQNNDNLKTTDVTIAATGGGGTSRNISTVIVSSVVAATASTDIVVIAGAGIKLTLPTAVGNTNLYTIKNKAASSVLVVPDGSETIDDDTNVILATRYTAIDIISDNANWHIT